MIELIGAGNSSALSRIRQLYAAHRIITCSQGKQNVSALKQGATRCGPLSACRRPPYSAGLALKTWGKHRNRSRVVVIFCIA
jgi:hypothetical protein